jgi:hypothetical protein
MSKLTLMMNRSTNLCMSRNLLAPQTYLNNSRKMRRTEREMGRAVEPPTSLLKSKKKRQIMVQSMGLKWTLIS